MFTSKEKQAIKDIAIKTAKTVVNPEFHSEESKQNSLKLGEYLSSELIKVADKVQNNKVFRMFMQTTGNDGAGSKLISDSNPKTAEDFKVLAIGLWLTMVQQKPEIILYHEFAPTIDGKDWAIFGTVLVEFKKIWEKSYECQAY